MNSFSVQFSLLPFKCVTLRKKCFPSHWILIILNGILVLWWRLALCNWLMRVALYNFIYIHTFHGSISVTKTTECGTSHKYTYLHSFCHVKCCIAWWQQCQLAKQFHNKNYGKCIMWVSVIVIVVSGITTIIPGCNRQERPVNWLNLTPTQYLCHTETPNAFFTFPCSKICRFIQVCSMHRVFYSLWKEQSQC